jgi:hypothetical protein
MPQNGYSRYGDDDVNGVRHVSELRPTGILFIPQVIMSMENHGGMISTGEN